MKYTHITVLGNIPIEYDMKTPAKLGDVIASGICNKTIKFKYAVTNNELELQNMINFSHYKDTMLLTNTGLYKKYFFFDNVDYLPIFGDVASVGLDFSELSNQNLALLLAIWSDADRIFLCGYDIEDLDEREILIKMMTNHPTTHFYFCRKPNINKIKLFDHLKNVKVFDYPEFKTYGKN
jgi:hypothetical protein